MPERIVVRDEDVESNIKRAMEGVRFCITYGTPAVRRTAEGAHSRLEYALRLLAAERGEEWPDMEEFRCKGCGVIQPWLEESGYCSPECYRESAREDADEARLQLYREEGRPDVA